MRGSKMFELAQQLATAKSRQDVAAALRLLHPDKLLENPVFGTSVRDLAANKVALMRWFAAFPDYAVEPHGHASNDDALFCWARCG